MFTKVLIANRGAIACRILRTLSQMGVPGVAVYAEADYASRHVALAAETFSLGDGNAAQTYLDAAKILAAAKASGAQAIHPGYGFLSENAAFAEACEDAGIAFIGPTPRQMRAFGLKHTARELARANGLPLLEGTGLLPGVDDAVRQAAHVGYPVMLKSTAGGGGIGMRVCRDQAELRAHFDAVRRLSENNFRDGGLFLERYIERARHIEVQVFGDGRGGVIALGERDCSVQRRNQKVIEETPAPNLSDRVRVQLQEAAVRLAAAVDYRSAGTVEFVCDAARDAFAFLEVNTRLQVEHGVTEQVFGVDLVRWMVALAAGELPPLDRLPRHASPVGHAVQARLYAEDPGKDFQPSPGLLTQVEFPAADGVGLRIDTWVESGCEVPPAFDPMIAKVIAHAPTRGEAITRLDAALAATRLSGVETNCAYLRQILAFEPFARGEAWTRCLSELRWRAPTIDVVVPGTQTTVQDWPGRTGYWNVGIPPSGPMDDRSFRLGNRLLGNPEGQAGLEIALSGPSLRFNAAATVALTGAEIPVTLDGKPVAMNRVLRIDAGSELAIGRIAGAGCRAYLTVLGGLHVPDYLGSRSTFTLGQFGGHAGRALRAGDVLHLADDRAAARVAALPPDLAMALPEVRTVRVLRGPQAAPEYFTDTYLARFFKAEWEVHFNSSRTGVRLIGPKPEWVREDGGEAGLHPSNIHDNAYAVGAVDFTGDMPVILGPDGPSLGGFVCPVTVIEADLWQLGQLKAGDLLRFVETDATHARTLAAARRQETATLRPVATANPAARQVSPIVHDSGAGPARLVARRAGDTYVLFEFGEPRIDLAVRFRLDAVMTALVGQRLDGVIDVTPGIRSLQVHFTPERITLAELIEAVGTLWSRYSATTDLRLPSRLVHLPLSWDDPATRLAIEKYTTTVRPDAPWCPSNIEFIRRINGLDSIADVKRIVFEARYLVLGLGDVYLGAPVATPLDPRHRLVTTKYNPARTWTPENAVGIGGAYLCVYGMEGPGGYQFVGRTLQMWNRHRPGPGSPRASGESAGPADSFHGEPYLLRFFDQIRFFEVEADELQRLRRDFPLGRYPVRIEETSLDLGAYETFLLEQAAGISAFTARRQAAFDAERAHWAATGLAHFEAAPESPEPAPDDALLPDEAGVFSPVAGNLWQVRVHLGDTVEAGQVIAVLEAMKMEIQVTAPSAGRVQALRAQPGSSLRAGQIVAVLSTGP